MIVILAGQNDDDARRLALHWSACLVTAADLSISGWRHYPCTIQQDTAVINKHKVAVSDITGVLTRRPCIFEEELSHIVPSDRAYVAAEMTAFLLSWLAGLTCPVLNQPTPTCLSGPGWRQEQWVGLAMHLGIPVYPFRRQARCKESCAVDAPIRHDTVTLVGGRPCGKADPVLVEHTQGLAAAAGVDLLSVRFSRERREPRLLSADLWPDVSSAEVADALLECFQEAPIC
jgi:hypothetical protein